VRFISVPRLPNTDDSAAARAHVTRVRSELARGAKFEDVAKRESSDSGSGQRGGDLAGSGRATPPRSWPVHAGRAEPEAGRAVGPRPDAVWLPPDSYRSGQGRLGETPSHPDPVALQGAHLDQVEARADTLERLAAERSDPTTLDTVARRLKLQVSPEYRVTENQGSCSAITGFRT